MCFIWLTAAAICFLLIEWIRQKRSYWERRRVPGPKAAFITGSLPKSFNGSCNVVEELHEIYLEYKSSQKFVGVLSGFSPKIFVLQPELASQILKSSFSSFHDNESSQWTSREVDQLRVCSPFVSTGTNWKERRTELTPALSLSKLRASYYKLRESAAKLIVHLESYSNVDRLDAKEMAHKFTADYMETFIWSLGTLESYSTTTSHIHEKAISMVTQAKKCVRFFERTGFCPWLRKLRPVRFFPSETDGFFQHLTGSVLEVRSAEGFSDGNDIVDYFLQLLDKKASVGYLEIFGLATTMLLDGFETAAVLIAHCLLLLSRNPSVQAKLRDELLEEPTKAETFEALNSLSYLEQCIQETLRIFPPLALFAKLCTKPTTISNGGAMQAIDVDEGNVVYISPYSFHHDADFFEDPEEFRPERFNAECGGVQKYREAGVFLPFGDGPRMCPGMKLGLLEAKVAVAEIVKHFRLYCSEDTRKDNKISPGDFLTSLEGGIHLHFEKLN